MWSSITPVNISKRLSHFSTFAFAFCSNTLAFNFCHVWGRMTQRHGLEGNQASYQATFLKCYELAIIISAVPKGTQLLRPIFGIMTILAPFIEISKWAIRLTIGNNMRCIGTGIETIRIIPLANMHSRTNLAATHIRKVLRVIQTTPVELRIVKDHIAHSSSNIA